MRKLARPGGGGPVLGRGQLGVCSGDETGCLRVASTHAAKTQQAGQGKAFLQNLEWAGTGYKERPECVHPSQIINWLGYRSHSRPVYTRPKSPLCPTWVFYSGSVT